MKEVTYVIRISEDIKKAFIRKAKENGTTASVEVRRFIQRYLKK